MAGKFPQDEASILSLAREIAKGLEVNPEVYPAPPVSPNEIKKSLARCEADRDAAIHAQALAEQATAAKKGSMAALEAEMKEVLRYAENTVHMDNAKLKLLGWSGHRAASPLEAPGQVPGLKAGEQGESYVVLSWKKPVSGGKPASYKVLRRERADGSEWAVVDATTENSVRLDGQTRGAALEYCVVAINKAGQGDMSNTVSVVL